MSSQKFDLPPIVDPTYSKAVVLAMFICLESSQNLILFPCTLRREILPTLRPSLDSYYLVTMFLVEVGIQKCHRLHFRGGIYEAVLG